MNLQARTSRLIAAILLTVSAFTLTARGESPERFVGTLTFEVSDGKLKAPIRYYSDGKRMRVEMGSPEMPSRIWLSSDQEVEGVFALSPFKKTYTIEQDELVLPHDMPRKDSREGDRKRRPITLPEPDSAEVMGLKCLHYKMETEGPEARVWILPNTLPIPLTAFGTWPDFVEAAPAIDKAIRAQKGLPLKIELVNWRGKVLFSLRLTDVDTASPGNIRFDLPEDYSRGGSAARLHKDPRDRYRN